MASTNTINKNARRGLLATGLLVGSLGAAAAIVNTSSAAFTATTENTANNWVAGTVALTDNDSGSKMFDVAGMIPGETSSRCIQVTYTGTASGVNPIKMYAALNSQTNDMANYLNVQVEQGTGSASDCSDFSSTASLISGETLVQVTSSYTDYATGKGTFIPSSSPASVAYKFTVTLDSATPNSVQGGTANSTFTWEIQTA